jgi:hypothetical protein
LYLARLEALWGLPAFCASGLAAVTAQALQKAGTFERTEKQAVTVFFSVFSAPRLQKMPWFG